jgi:hypothetical protein
LPSTRRGQLLSLPTIADADEAIPVWGGSRYHRASGEALSPERESIDAAVDGRNAQKAESAGGFDERTKSTRSGPLPSDEERVETLRKLPLAEGDRSARSERL